MTELSQDITIAQTLALLSRYGFEMKGYSSSELLERWQQHYPAKWIRLAIIEALYQGRYKIISIEHILNLWQRRGQTTFHFTHEFERLICRNLPHSLINDDNSSVKSRRAKNQRKLTPYHPSVSNYHPSVKEEMGKGETAEGESQQKDEETVIKEEAETVSCVDLSPDKENNGQGETAKKPLTDLSYLMSQYFPQREAPESSVENGAPSLNGSENHPRSTTPGQSINEFTPLLDPSELYSKLKAVAKQELGQESPEKPPLVSHVTESRE